MKSAPHCRDVVLLDHTGQLGNRLILMSHFIAAAEEFGFRVHDFALAPHRKNFAGLVHNPFFTYPSRHVGWDAGAITKALRKPLASWLKRRGPVLEGKEGWLGYFDANHRPGIRLDGEGFERWMSLHRVFIPWGYDYRCIPWVDKHLPKIREFLKPVGEHATRAATLLEKIRSAGRIPVGIHMRIGGDQKTFYGGRWYFPPEVYLEWMRQLLRLFGGKPVTFVVCSDEPLPTGLLDPLPAVYTPRHLAEDFALLYGCDYVMGTVSTFSEMACLLGGKPLYVFAERDQNPTSLEDFKIPDFKNRVLTL